MCSLFMDFTLLVLFCRLTNAKSSVIRIFFAATLGAFLGCLVICINIHNTYINLVFGFLISFVMIYILYFKKIKMTFMQLIRYTMVWYVLAFFVYGTAIYIFKDGFDIQKMFITAAVMISVSEVIKYTGFIKTIRHTDSYLYRIVIHINGRMLKGYARYDSANMLVEPISGADVIVVCIDTMKSYLTEKESEFIRLFPMLPDSWDGVTYIRGIPYNTVDGRGIFPGLRTDKVDIISGNATVSYYGCYLAITERPVSSDSTYDFLLNYKLKGEGVI